MSNVRQFVDLDGDLNLQHFVRFFLDKHFDTVEKFDAIYDDWHGDDQYDINFYREESDPNFPERTWVRFAVYPVVVGPNGFLTTDTSQVLLSGGIVYESETTA